MPVPGHKPDIIIAGASVRSLAESAVRSGLNSICVDLFADSDLTLLLSEAGLPPQNVRRILSFDQLESAISDVSVSVPLVPVGGLEVCSEVLGRIGSVRRIFAMSAQAIEFLNAPASLFPVLLDAGYHVPKFVCSRGESSRLADTSGTWLKKDSGSSGGHHVERIKHGRLNDTLAALSPSEFLQQEAVGQPCSATFLADSQKHLRLLGCASQLCGKPALNAAGFQFCGNVGPIQLPQFAIQQLQAIAETLNQRVPLKGAFGIDFILQQDRVIPIEVNSRLTASHELHERLDSLVLQHCEAFDPDAFQMRSSQTSEPDDSKVRARMILYSDRTFTFSSEAYSGLLPFRRCLHSSVPPFWISDLPAPESIIEAETPFCSLIFEVAGSECLPSVKDQIDRVATHVPIINSAAIADLLQDVVGRY